MKLLSAILLFVVFAFSVIPVQATGNTYYVATNGNDTNPGSITQPWRTFSKAVSTVSPGDTVYIRGGTYHEILLAYRDGGGTVGNYVTYASYPGETAILDGTNIAIEHGEGLVTLKVVDYVKISGLKIQNSNGAGIYVAYSNNISIEKNQTYDTVKSGIGLWGVTNSIVDGNDISMACHDHLNYSSSEEPITISSSIQIEVMNNTVHDGPTDQNSARAGGEGINVKENSHDIEIHHNTVYNLIDKVGLSVDAWGGNLYNVYIRYNTSYNNRVGALVSNEVNTGSTHDVFITNNLIYNCSFAGIYVPSYMGNGPLANITITGNTLTNNGYGFYLNSTNATNIVIKNNILNDNITDIYLNPNGANGYIIEQGTPTSTLTPTKIFTKTPTRTPTRTATQKPTATKTPECIPVIFSDGIKIIVCK